MSMVPKFFQNVSSKLYSSWKFLYSDLLVMIADVIMYVIPARPQVAGDSQ